MAARSKVRDNIYIFDFESEQHGHYTQLTTLFDILKQRCVDNRGFWGNRAMIAANTKKLIIAQYIGTDHEVPDQVGFCLTSRDKEKHILYIQLIEAFVKRRGIATFMLDFLVQKYIDKHQRQPVVLIDEMVAGSEKFWSVYFERRKFAGMAEWYVDHDTGGPHLTFTKTFTPATFCALLDDIRVSTNSEAVLPGSNRFGGIEIKNYKRLGTDIYFHFPTNKILARYDGRYHSWPSDRSEWPDSTAILIDSGVSFQTDFRFDRAFVVLKDELVLFKSIFQKHGVEFKFICQ